ncbi:MAG: ComF family protein [Clostridiales bacterium]|nr:ComF family protein [Clostridiales bacterium]
MHKLIDLTDCLLTALYPRRCALCGKVIPPTADMCKDCEATVPRVLPPVCILCGRSKEECFCKNFRFYYSGLVAPFYYEDAVRRCIHQFKFYGKTQNARMLGKAMADTVRREFAGITFDFVTGVPLTSKSLKSRGFNQSKLLAVEVGKRLAIKPAHDLLVKIYDTPAQHTMNSSMRRGNLAGVFDVVNPRAIKDKTILICDDVATTSSTINECSKMLLLSGAKEVYCVTAAVTRKAK